METDLQKIYEEFLQLLENGSEKEAEQFLISKITLLPQDAQEEILFSLFEQGIAESVQEGTILGALRKRIEENLNTLRINKRKIEDGLKILELERKADQK